MADLLERWAIPPASLTLEITERAIIANRPAAIEVVNALAGLGLQLAMDDFGTGYSSLANLTQLPVHELKIDGSFVAGLFTDATGPGHRLLDDRAGTHAGPADRRRGRRGSGHARGVAGYAGHDVAPGYHIARPMPRAPG